MKTSTLQVLLLLLSIFWVFGQVTIFGQGRDGFTNMIPMNNFTINRSAEGRVIAKIGVTNGETFVLLTDGSMYIRGGISGSTQFKPMDQSSGPSQGKLFQMFAPGHQHAYFLTTDQLLLCYTQQNNGECGQTGGSIAYPPIAVDQTGALAGKSIRGICSGKYFTSILSTQNEVFGVGVSDGGQYGLNTLNTNPVAVPIPGVHGNITQLACGVETTYLLTETGKLYATGANNYGELGTPDATNPQFGFIAASLDVIIVKMYVGGSHVIFKAPNGFHYGFGRGAAIGWPTNTEAPRQLQYKFENFMPGLDFTIAIEKQTRYLWGSGLNNKNQISSTGFPSTNWTMMQQGFVSTAYNPVLWSLGGGSSNQHWMLNIYNNFTCYGEPVENSCTLNGDCMPDTQTCECYDGYTGMLCNTCKPGRYLAFPENTTLLKCYNCPFRTITNTTNATSCTECRWGEYSNDGINCSTCLPGSYVLYQNNSYGECFQCPAGTFSYAGAYGIEGCQQCPANTYSTPGSGTGCAFCPGGYSSPPGSSNCTACPIGYFSNSGSYCQICPYASWSDKPGSARCTSCGLGKWMKIVNTNIITCELCPVNTIQNVYAASSIDDCLPCAPGSAPTPAGSSVCSLCPPGTYGSMLTGVYNCTKCPINTYSTKSGATSESTCVNCPRGFYANTTGNPSSEACKPCPLGQWTHGAYCYSCPPNTYSDKMIFSQNECMQCPLGTATPNYGTNSEADCSPCPAGTYGTLKNACAKCPINTYSTTIGAKFVDSCLPCPRGFYYGGIGASSVSACVACPIGHYLSNATCFPCPPGTKRSAADVECVFCPVGTYNSLSGNYMCFNCENTTYCPLGSTEPLPIDFTTTSKDSLGNIMDPRDLVLLKTQQKDDRVIKLVSISIWLAIGLCIMILVFILTYFIGGKSLHHLDKFYAEKHKTPQNTSLIHKETSCGGVFSAIAFYIVIAIVIQSSLDFFINNSQERTNLMLTTSPHLLNAPMNISFNTTIPGKAYCNAATNDASGFSTPFENSIKVGRTSIGCNIVTTCQNCTFLGNQPKYCIHFTDTDAAFTSLVLYQINVTSVVRGKDYVIKGAVLSGDQKVMGGDQTTGIFISLFRTRYLQIKGGLAAWGEHMFDTIATNQDPIYDGLTGFVESTAIGNTQTNVLDTSPTGFNICYNLNISPAVYYIEEYTKQTFIGFLAQIAALSAATIQIIGLIFMLTEFCFVSLHRLYNKHKGGDIEMKEVEDMSDVDKMKKSIEELLEWKDAKAMEVQVEGIGEQTPQNHQYNGVAPVIVAQHNVEDDAAVVEEIKIESQHDQELPVQVSVEEHEGPINDNHSEVPSHPLDDIFDTDYAFTPGDNHDFREIDTPVNGPGYSPSPTPDTRIDGVPDE